MREIKQILKLIEEKKDLDFNLTLFSNLVTTKFTELGMVNLSTSLYLDCDNLLNHRDLNGSLKSDYLNNNVSNNLNNDDYFELQQILKTVKTIIDTCIIEGDASLFEKSLLQLDDLRKKISEKVNLLSAYSDSFSIYKKVIENRISENAQYDTILSDEEYTSLIVKHIFANKDKMVTNIRIQEALRKLPIRISRTKFFNLVEQAISVYQGGSKNNLKYFTDLIENYAMLSRPKGYGEEFTTVFEQLIRCDESLNNEEKTIPDQDFIDGFNELYGQVEDLTDSYIQAMKIVNDLYSVLLTLPYVMENSKIIDTCNLIITKVSEQLGNGDIDEESIESIFRHFEYNQEHLNETVIAISDKLDSVITTNRKEIEDLFLNEKYNALIKAQSFYTNSLFMNIMGMEEDSITDSKTIKEAQATLINKLLNSFQNQTRELNRVIMAEILGELPIFFHSVQEVTDYVLNSLKSCGNVNEKIVCIYSILNE